jgi:ferredoxin-NADP reductase
VTADSDQEFEVVVTSRIAGAERVAVLEVERADGEMLPAWEPGAHIDLLLPGLGDSVAEHAERQYSLCGSPSASAWRIGVLRELDGRGGSAWVHSSVSAGSRLRARGPRNHFAFSPDGSRVLFIAGGIGITPILPMIEAAATAGLDWQLAYAGHSRETMAFADGLVEQYPSRVSLFVAAEGNRIELQQLLGTPADGTSIYCCGPARLMDAVEEACGSWPHGTLHLERFEPKDVAAPVMDEPFEVELELSGITVTVPPDRSILEVVEEAGALVLSSCREGTCGTCETPVVEGVVDHRDSVLTPDEQADNTVMMICVSRSACPRLVLEL